jgi:hypothetical protein
MAGWCGGSGQRPPTERIPSAGTLTFVTGAAGLSPGRIAGAWRFHAAHGNIVLCRCHGQVVEAKALIAGHALSSDTLQPIRAIDGLTRA